MWFVVISPLYHIPLAVWQSDSNNDFRKYLNHVPISQKRIAPRQELNLYLASILMSMRHRYTTRDKTLQVRLADSGRSSTCSRSHLSKYQGSNIFEYSSVQVPIFRCRYIDMSSINFIAPPLPTIILTSPSVFVANPASQ